MVPFGYARAADLDEALTLLEQGGVAVLAGGTEILNWLRLGIAGPERLLDVSRLDGLAAIAPVGASGLRIGALAKLNDVAADSAVEEKFPVLAQAIRQAASAQLRNLATIGGNLLQKTRCAYFRAEEPLPCNKREPGSGCSALHGFNEHHAIFGWSDWCVATHPSDPAVALAALDATLVLHSRRGERRLAVTDFHLLPANTDGAEADLRPDELITAIELAAPAPHSAYVKVRERQSYEYALVSAAAVLDLDGDGTIRNARLALGSVALKPWRLGEAERRLTGMRPGTPEVAAALDDAMRAARPLAMNGYKVALARNALLRAVELAAEDQP